VSAWLVVAAAGGLLFFSAVFSGAETGVYSISRVRLEAEALEGRRGARLLARLLRNDAALLITLLVGHNLVLELLTHLTEAGVSRSSVPAYARELVAAAILTPLVFLCGELIPKDLFRRRPHALLMLVAPFVALFRWLASPLVWPLAVLASALERVLGLRREDLKRMLRREEMLELLAESRRAGGLAPQAETLAHNALYLRHTPLGRVAIPWARVEWIDLDKGEEPARAAILQSGFTRLPLSGTGRDKKRALLGYVHQLDVLGAAPEAPLSGFVRPLLELPADLPLDRAVARLQAAGQRLAVVGSLRAPKGLVSLMDLLSALASQPRFPQPAPAARIGSDP
jgi:CBS domain containing-hemolysin-like protein